MNNPKIRSDHMKRLFANADPKELEKQLRAPTEDIPKLSAGPVKSMQQTFSAVETENDNLRRQLEANETVVEIDASRVIPSFIRDRLDLEADAEFAAFVEDIAQIGQQLPILVRPVEGKPGYYQAAYGHRRLRACQILAKPVRAIVRGLSDRELVLAQGIENSQRANLSFLEQALFAIEMKRNGFDRETISLALGRGKDKGLAYISILTATVAEIPEDLLRLIGAAPNIGRPKWEKLGSFFKEPPLKPEQNAVITSLLSSERWKAMKSDDRFTELLALLSKQQDTESDANVYNCGDGFLVTAKQSAKATHIYFPNDRLPGLTEWLIARLPNLITEFKEQQPSGRGGKL
jgi:ParB family chromosome partitioning protein